MDKYLLPMINIDKKQILNVIAKAFLYSFYFSALLVFLCNIMPWFQAWSLIEMPLLFAPRWWVIFLLVPVVILRASILLKQKKCVLLSLFIYIFFYLNFSIPINSLFPKLKGQAIAVMSANLGGGIKDHNLMKKHITNEQLALIAFQETPKEEAKKIVPQGWDLHCVGQMCLSSAYKLEFIDSQSRRMLGGWGQFGLLYQMQVNEKKVYVMNLHLETPRKGFEDFQLSKLNFNAIFKNTEKRYLEANIIASWLKDKTPLIILGDFNMPVESSIYRDNFGIYQNSFNKAGFGFGYTKHTRMLGIRIDHILVDKNFSVVDAKVGRDVGSDHNPVIANIVLH